MEKISSPLTVKQKEQLISFLDNQNLFYDENNSYTIIYKENDKIIATISVDECIIKDIAIDESQRGNNIAEIMMSDISSYCSDNGIFDLMLYTKPEYYRMFSSFGYYPIYKDERIIFMENRKNGINNYFKNIGEKHPTTNNGIIILHGNPLTNGHVYLINKAKEEVDHLFIFVVNHEKSMFTTAERFSLVKKQFENQSNISVHLSNYYQVSSATFPDYFYKREISKQKVKSDVDVYIFENYIINNLHITKRFLGKEPNDEVTDSYNKALKERLSNKIDIIEMDRYNNISASYIRQNINNIEIIKDLVPEVTLQLIRSRKWSAQ